MQFAQSLSFTDFAWCIILLLGICFKLKLLWKQKKKTKTTKPQSFYKCSLAVWVQNPHAEYLDGWLSVAAILWELRFTPSQLLLPCQCHRQRSLGTAPGTGSPGSSPTSAAVGTSVGLQRDKPWLKRCETTRPYTLMPCDP